MVRQLGMHPGYYTGMSQVISRMASEINTAVSGATGVVNSFTMYNMNKLATEDPEKFKEKYPREAARMEKNAD